MNPEQTVTTTTTTTYEQINLNQPTATQTVYTTTVPIQPIVTQTAYTTATTPWKIGDQWIQPTQNGVPPVLVALVDFLIPGIGHLLIGQMNKGLSLFLVSMIMSFAISFLSMFLIGLCIVPVLFVWVIFVMVDGYKLASRLANGTPIMKGECTSKFVLMGSNILSVQDEIYFLNTSPEQLPADYIEKTTKAHSIA